MTQTIGQKLRAEREAQKLTLEKVFEVTRIRVPYLQALEEDNLSRVPSPVQARGYLRNYAEYLGLNFEQLLDEMRVASLQQATGEVIGPADDAPTLRHSLPSRDSAILGAQSATQTPEPPNAPQDEPIRVEEATPLASPQPKPVRRKKLDSQLKPTSVQSTPKRRGRKKIEPQP
jgi:cytoskeletal protein RodZ